MFPIPNTYNINNGAATSDLICEKCQSYQLILEIEDRYLRRK